MKVIKFKKLQNGEKEYLIKQIKNDKDRFFNELPNDDSYTIKENDTIIPAFINIKNDIAILLWVNEKFRKKGYGKFLVESLNIKYTQAYYTSIPFWKSLGFKTVNSKGVICMQKY